jgi:hypothetical protein
LGKNPWVFKLRSAQATSSFTFEDGEIRTTRPFMPAMLTLDERAIRQDCLCYLMERLEAPV